MVRKYKNEIRKEMSMIMNPDCINIKYGTLIKNIRESRGMSREELGELVGLSYDRIQQYENDIREPRINLLNKIFDALEVDVEIDYNFSIKDKSEKSDLVEKNEKNIFGTRLKIFRREILRCSQCELAELTGISQSAIADYEAGRMEPSINTALKIADLCSTSVDCLLGRDKDFENLIHKYFPTAASSGFRKEYESLNTKKEE